MEQLYPRNILERHYPILREQREREEREEEEEAFQSTAEMGSYFNPREGALHENEPLRGGSVGRTLNTIA
ncbi:hypothetical protein IEN85_21410 [Pelagicoccus sp. NFK12]|uniref:Uncharacterized protein n=1 Tax=Pelagicoccus enzymogenes TaxID=2773457 RepID=A0A927IJ86_9BACT|nr:hypothetical protein [Pelagicoccus enzymogenes]MBD5782071.1 hypothetical protein [Pelagicoccus enzymogenes]